ncbi:MAG: PD-(D/E)XK nuclease family protein [Nitrospirae bacterium]|nr:PD-(D/E)XK nuclease family protein [Nitrospirota bacterium]
MNYQIIPPDRDLIHVILSGLSASGKDYSSNMVIFPGKRPAHFLRKALADELKSGFIPPVCCSMDEFIDSVYEEFGAARKIDTLDAVAILHEIHRNSGDPIGGEGFMTADRFLPVGMKIYGDLEELTIEGINPHLVREIESVTDESLPEQTRKRLQSLSFFYEEFYSRIRGMGLSTRSMRYRFAAEKGVDASPGRFTRIIFAGFFGLTKTEEDIFRQLLSRDNTLFIFQSGPGLREAVSGLGLDVPDDESENLPYPEVSFYSGPDAHGQVFALAGILDATPAAAVTPDSRTVIVLPSSDSLFPLLRHGLSGMPEDSYNISLGYPLNRTPVFGFLNNLMELTASMDRDRVYAPDYLKFVLHPYTKNVSLDGRSEPTRILFHTIEEELTERRTKTFLRPSDIEEDDELLDKVLRRLSDDETLIGREDLREHLKSIHAATVGKFTGFRNIRDFGTKLREVLVYIFNNSTARLHPFFHPFAESFISSLDDLDRSMIREVAFEEPSSYFAFFRKYVMTCHTPFSGTPVKGLQVLGFLETRGLKFDRVFVLDANEGSLPNTKKEDSLIPFKARKMLGLPTYIERDKISGYYFDTLLRGCREARIFFAENSSLERSRFVEKLLWRRQKTDRTKFEKRYIHSINYQVNLINRSPLPVDKTEGIVCFLKNQSYGATLLDRYLKCPLKFYYATVLGLGRRQDLTGEIGRVDIGNFVHTVVRAYFSPVKGRPLKEKDMDAARMRALVGQLFMREFGEEASGGPYLLKRQISRRLEDLVVRYYLPLANEQPVTVLSQEESLNMVFGGFHLKGRIDSLEQRGDKTVIVDYKTGSNPDSLRIDLAELDLDVRETWNTAIGSLQLPFYLMLYAEGRGMPVRDLEAMFLMLGRSAIGREIELPLFSGDSDAEASYALLKTVILRLLEEITDPDTPFGPAPDMKKTCPSCDFNYICGTQWIVR